MKSARVICIALVLFLHLNVRVVNAARILGIFPHPGKSHFDVFQPLLEGLAAKGHNVTVVGFFPHADPPKGYHDISLAGVMSTFTNAIPMSEFEQQLGGDFLRPLVQFLFLAEMGLDACRAILPTPQIQALLHAHGQYDIVIIEHFDTDCFLTIPYLLQLPHIGISSCAMLPWLNSRMGNPQDASYVNNVLTGVGPRMTLLQRLSNTIVNFITSLLYYPLFQLPAQRLVHQHVGPVPPLQELALNSSLMLVNSHFTLQQPRPMQPAVVEIGGIHVAPPKPLPKDLDEFVSGAEHGVIVFSMGSILNAATLDENKRRIFVEVFGSLPQRIVWKIGGDVKDLPPNVKTMSWLPQRDILAHANVKAFLAHGGLLGMTEAVVSATPMVVMPMFGDQHNNIQAAVHAGIGIHLHFHHLTVHTLKQALLAVLAPQYQKRAAEVASAYNDRPVGPLELAIYWVEYIVKHGQRPLDTPAPHLSAIQYYLLDVYAIILACLAITYIILNKIAAFIFGRISVQKNKQD